MIKIKIHSDSRYSVDRKRVREAVRQVLNTQGVSGDVSLEVYIVGDRKMSFLNKKFMKKAGTTDVLSFPLISTDGAGFVEPPTEVMCLGDVVVSFPQAVKQAMELNHSVDDEIAMLVSHGLLHLLGIHHD